jgi:hypothetical protein
MHLLTYCSSSELCGNPNCAGFALPATVPVPTYYRTGRGCVHAKFYESIRDRFRRKLDIDAFRQTHFSNDTVIGMHVRRAGNEERGDFLFK